MRKLLDAVYNEESGGDLETFYVKAVGLENIPEVHTWRRKRTDDDDKMSRMSEEKSVKIKRKRPKVDTSSKQHPNKEVE
ncbi:hypothetical protein AVEN_68532-1 [Araneus ventricosus]|uniref:Uncharacterized protein n=1 Tax=Araneus ventricosus TaxID=182803 RepID=A0A4Y2HCQ3_ARAVE|nr:hypothetical protein AVEN_68532-1 [Araneus ventricosus]